MRVLALCGSLAANSTNRRALAAAATLAPAGMIVLLDGTPADLPPFNPDDDRDGVHAASSVAAFRARLAEADGLLISIPEYARGIPGAFKNALDWVVSSGETASLPVVTINTAPRAHHAQAALLDVLATMACEIVPGSPFTLPWATSDVTDAGIAADPAAAAILREALEALAAAIRARAGTAPPRIPGPGGPPGRPPA